MSVHALRGGARAEYDVVLVGAGLVELSGS